MRINSTLVSRSSAHTLCTAGVIMQLRKCVPIFFLPGDTEWLPGQEPSPSPWDLVRKPLSQSITIRLKGTKSRVCVHCAALSQKPKSEPPALITNAICWMKGPNKSVWMCLQHGQIFTETCPMSRSTWTRTEARTFVCRKSQQKMIRSDQMDYLVPVMSHKAEVAVLV